MLRTGVLLKIMPVKNKYVQLYKLKISRFKPPKGKKWPRLLYLKTESYFLESSLVSSSHAGRSRGLTLHVVFWSSNAKTSPFLTGHAPTAEFYRDI